MIAGAHAVLWVRSGGRGNDACRFADAQGGFLVDGSATDAEWNVLRYRIRARDDGTTRRVRIGNASRVLIRRAADDTWRLNDTEVPAVTGAKDIDLAFTPATHTLPIRRLNLPVGEEVSLLVAQFDPERGTLEPLQRVYRRLSDKRYECETLDTGKVARFKVDRQNAVRDHDGGWSAQK